MLCSERQQDAVHAAKVGGVVQSCNAGSRFLGRPSVGGRPAAGGARNKQEVQGNPCRRPPRFGRVARECTSSQAHVARLHSPSGKAQSLIGSAAFASAMSCTSEPLSLLASSVLGAARGPAEYRSAKVRGPCWAPANTPAQSGVSTLRVPEFAMHLSQASNPSIERTSQRPLRALWPAAHVER